MEPHDDGYEKQDTGPDGFVPRISVRDEQDAAVVAAALISSIHELTKPSVAIQHHPLVITANIRRRADLIDVIVKDLRARVNGEINEDVAEALDDFLKEVLDKSTEDE